MVMQRRPPSPNSMDVPNHTPPPKLQEHVPTEVRKRAWCHKARRLASVRRATHTNSKHRGRTPAKEQSEVPFSCKSYQFFTSACGNRFQSWIQVDSMLQCNAVGFGACRQTSQVTTAWAVKHGSRAWAAAASTRLCSRFRRRFFCRPPLSVPVANASDHKTLRRSAEDVISCLMGARQRPRFRTRACQLTQARRRVTTIHATALGTSARAGEGHGFAKHACRSGARSTAAHRRPHALHKDLRSAFSIYGWRPIRSDKAHCPL